jgi:hypothetical protein
VAVSNNSEGAKESVAVMDAQSDGSMLDLVDELARVIFDPEEAKVLILRAGFPPAGLPSFSTPAVFWSQVVRTTTNGKLVNGMQTLLDEVTKQYPANAIFAAHRSRAVAVARVASHRTRTRHATSGLGIGPPERNQCRTRVIDESSIAQPKLLLINPVCERSTDREWQIRLSVAFRRHRVFPRTAVTTNLTFAAAGAWITAEAESSEIVECSVEPSRQNEITPTKAGTTRAEWSCDPRQNHGRERGFLEGNETLLLTYRASQGGSLTTCGRTTGIVFVDASGNPIRSDLKNMALRIKLWNLARKLTLPSPHEVESRHRIIVIPDQDESE